MKSRRFMAADEAATIIGVALVWLAFFKLNALAFDQFAHSSRAHWIFLPAALRILFVLMFDGSGAVGLIIGAYLTLPHSQSGDLPYELMLSVSSGLGPLIAIWLCRRIFPIARDLAGLRGKHIIALSIVGATANSMLVNGCMAIAGRWRGDLEQFATIFIGDMLGTVILLTVIAGAVMVVTRAFERTNTSN